MSTIIIFAFAVFTTAFFAPLEVYLGNISNFQIYANSAILVLFLLSVVATLVASVVLSFLPIKILKTINIAVFAITVCFYIQSLFLNGQVISLVGEKQVFTKGATVINILVWLAIIALTFVMWRLLKKTKKEKLFLTAIKFISLSLVVMQLVGLTSVYISCDKSTASKNCYFSKEGELEVSGQNNVLYFIIDTCSGYIVDATLKECPDLFDELYGFTYYPNASSTYSRTYPAIPYLLSQEKCYFDLPAPEYINNAFEKSNFIPTIKSLGADIRLYTEAAYIGESAKSDIDNIRYTTVDARNINLMGFIKESAKISLFRGAPYVAKMRFAYTAEGVNRAITSAITDKADIYNDFAFYQQIQTDKVTVNEEYDAAFRFYHMFGTHPGVFIDENAEYDPDASVTDALKGIVKILKEYFQQLKDLGVYDNTTIIITADHGSSSGGENLEIPQDTSCLMLVKPANADSSQKVKVSQAPVCHEDLFATVIDSLGGDASGFGRSITEIGEEEERERLYYYSALYSDSDGEIALVEYALQGDARSWPNYIATGNYWDIQYSMNSVSSKGLK